MILFIAPNPNTVKNREGFLQRVAAIDSLFANTKKVYSGDLENSDSLAQAMLEADLIYVHSMYNANKIVQCYEMFSHKIITDLHGVVPEEELYTDNQEMFRIMRETEKEVFKHGKYFVAVTTTMKEHFVKKYKDYSSKKWVVLPIYARNKKRTSDFSEKDYRSVVYAGGAQPWQNVDLMVETIRQSKGYKYRILTSDLEAFTKRTSDVKEGLDIRSVDSEKVFDYYKDASFGFILRKDTLVNNVACPTKLVEYLSEGVVPIVLSDNIGDFKTMGYRYVQLNDFRAGGVTDKFIQKAQEQNRVIFESFIESIEHAQRNLVKLTKDIIKYHQEKIVILPEKVIAEKILVQEKFNRLEKLEFQVEEYKKRIGEYAEAVQYYKEEGLKKEPNNPLNRTKHIINAFYKKTK